LFLFENCEVKIRPEHEMAGRLDRFDKPSGNVRAAYDLYVNSAEKALFDYIIGLE
jgi:hypothetical protein